MAAYLIPAMVAVVVLVGSCPAALWQARDAERTGRMRMYQRFKGHSTLLRADDPLRFDLHVRRLRAVPWVVACIVAGLIMMLGLAR